MKNLKYLLLFLTVAWWGCGTPEPIAQKGVLDLSSWNFEKQGNIALNGEWAFYWERFSDKGDVSQLDSIGYLFVPGGWSKSFPAHGHACYRLQVKVNDEDSHYKLKINKVHAAIKVWVNGELFTEFGRISDDKEGEVSGAPDLIEIIGKSVEAKEGILDIVIDVSNHKLNGSYQGIVRGIEFGKESIVLEDTLRSSVYNALVIGLLLIIGLYHFVLFFYRQKELSTLVFAFLSLFFAIRTAYAADFLYGVAMFNYELGWKLAYITLPIYPTLMYVFLRILFPQELSKKIGYVVVFVSSAFVLSILIFSSSIIGLMDTPIGIFALLLEFYLLFATGQAVWRKRQGAVWAFGGMIVFLVATINDLLFATGVIDSLYLAQYGMAAYTLLQSANLAERFSLAFTTTERLTEELDYKNKNLEKIVDQRTAEVESKKKEVEEKAERLTEINSELVEKQEEIQQQSEELMTQAEMLERVNGELHLQREHLMGSIRYAKTIQQAILPLKTTTDLYFNSFVLYYPKDIVSGDFYWFSQIKSLDYRFLVVADCTGHGVPGAFMSMIGSRLLGEIINIQQVYETDLVVTELDKNIQKALQQSITENNDGMDLIICRLHPLEDSSIEVQFTGAKRPLIYVRKQEGKVEIIKGDRKSIGGVRSQNVKSSFTNTVLTMQKGDRLYLTGDGYTDQCAPSRQRFGSKRLYDLLDQIKDLDIIGQAEKMDEAMHAHMQDELQRDDITVWGIELK